MAIKLADKATVDAADAIGNGTDDGAGAGKLKIYTGAPETDPDSAPGGTLLATLTMSDPAFAGAAVVGADAENAANAITDETSATAGTAGSFRLEDSNGAAVLTGTVTATGGGGDMELSTVTIPTGGTVQITAFTLKVTRD